MERTIAINGEGTIFAAPDTTRVSLSLRSRDADYVKAAEKATADMEELIAALQKAGFDRKELKTNRYSVSTEYDDESDDKGHYKRVFKGYICRHALNISFGVDAKLLSAVLCTASGCKGRPAIGISFSLKDGEKYTAQALSAAAQDAKMRAEALCAASGCNLGELMRIESGTSGTGFLSTTEYSVDYSRSTIQYRRMDPNTAPDIAPEDIEITENAVFVWTLL